MKFMDLVINNTSLNIDDFIEEWHNSDTELSLCEYLGMTDYEYSRWLSNPNILNTIIIERISTLDD